ncbi:DUF397 domain-containing protein [Streptomyces sp. NPDC058867]|uniref:DUF397 domain-containing protein n=1 Tax=unclassified Streptomyces TaxID=2593676 RepID=UPI0036A368B1
MPTHDTWTKSSYSGGGQGDACVEIAHLHPRIAIRDSKDHTRAPLSFPTEAFSALVRSLKRDAEQ